MKISFENPDKINGLMTLTVEVDDYKEKVEKTLKDYRKKANVPGFRPGNVPMNIIRRQYGTAVKADVVNKLIGEEMYKYLRENNVKMLGEPLPSEKQVPQDLEKEGNYEFIFDIAVAPEFSISLSKKDSVDFYDIQPDDNLIDQQVERDMLKGDLRQLDEEGNTLEGGITVADAVLMPQYIKEESQKALFNDAKLGDIITFNPKKAYPESDAEVAALLKLKKEEVADINADFSYQVTEISRFVKSELDQELFDSVFGEGNVTTEDEFRSRIGEGLKAQLAGESDFRFLLDVRKYAEDKVGELTFPEDILKRVMKAGNKDKDADYVDKHFDASIRELKWHLIKEQLVADNQVKIEDADVKTVAKEMARAQFAQYGMNNVPDEYLDSYANDMLKQRENIDSLVDRAIDRKLIDVLKNVVKLNVKTVTLDEFNKIAAE